ncbi:hypothetical protein [Nocardia sp. BMG51109]|uniref:hypothetical protein n=1 Tax=Nocardia sp. BMG51109 TaxID=1056816 RepID=UPI00046721F6|nr:hypothetical protein [Nocardia sp. BMG51109]
MSPVEQQQDERDARWSTYPNSRTVLAVVHNITAATRLFDVLGVLASDPRIRIEFSRTGSSAFDADTSGFLEARGARETPWRTALTQSFDLAVAASYGGELHRIQAPLAVVPHGMGYNKFLAANRKSQIANHVESPVFGLSEEWLMYDGRVVPSLIVLSHSEQRDRLLRSCPEADPKALVAGDICFDRLHASTPLRATYRRAFDVRPQQKLIVISSTWGRDSLLAVHPELPRTLAAALPADDYRVTLAVHPNVPAHHSRWQLSEYLSGAARAGVHIPDTVDDWRTALVAADLVVGDHGSVSFYGAALGLPLLLATAPTHTVDPGSPIAQLLTAAPRFDESADPTHQIRSTIADHVADRYAEITTLTTSEPGCGAAVLRTALYELLDLAEPTEPAELDALPLPRRPITGPDSHVVQVVTGSDRTATITRYPAESLRAGTSPRPGTHLAAGVREPRVRWLQLADLVIGGAGNDTERWITDTLTRMPGCAWATAPESPGRWLLGDGEHLLRVDGSDHACRLFASLAYHLVARGGTVPDLAGRWTMHCGGEALSVTAIETTERKATRSSAGKP